jgi:outer membrane phospholipase A
VTSVFVTPSSPLVAGSRGSLWLYRLNNSSHEVTQTFERSLPGTLVSQSGAIGTVLFLNTNGSAVQATIAPGGFVKAEYELEIPATSSGQVTLEAGHFHPVVILVTNGVSGVPVAATITPSASVQTQTAAGSELMDYFTGHISYYEPIYFILGSYPAAEFQFSLKYQVFSFTNRLNPLADLYFAYTQTSFWDLLTTDPSFYDTSYKPSAFLYYPGLIHRGLFHLNLQGGYEHESNGHGGTLERSLNTAYLQSAATFDLPDHFELTLQPRAWYYLSVGNNNPNLADYRGYADLLTTVTWTEPDWGEKIQFATRLRIGDEGSHAGLLFDLRFNLPLFTKFNPTLQVQYFTGYGQTLRQYNQTSHAIRAGLCLWY